MREGSVIFIFIFIYICSMPPLKTFMAQTMRLLFNYFIPIISVYLCKRERERVWYEPAGMESLEPTISLKTHPRKPKSSQWMENLDPLRTRFKNLDYIKIKTRWRTCLKNSNYKEERYKGCDLPLISSIKNKRRKLNSQWKFNILSAFKWGYKEYLNQNLIKTLTKIKPFFQKYPCVNSAALQ